ncbi:hypothetical protein MC885_005289 [Smutsia gigantea]|nr:hypothetical protein MC885_005289 [Smutsia gigantea]
MLQTCELDMISTRVMDIKLREAAEGLGEDSTGKKKSKFKTFKKFFGKKKRKESSPSTGSSTWKQSQAKSEVIAIESGPMGYDSEDELEESRGALGSRALSHDSIFIPESGQDPARPVRVFSQENVCDRIKALQLKIQCNVKMGPPPPPGSLPVKRGDDAGMSSEDDGLPRSPPEMSLLHDMDLKYVILCKAQRQVRKTEFDIRRELCWLCPFPVWKLMIGVSAPCPMKVSLVSSPRLLSPDHSNDATVSPRTSDSSMAPVADFDYPPEFSSCLDNSAAKHKLLVKPRNQRSSKMRRLSSRAQSESLSDLTCTPEEEECDEKQLPKVSAEENPSSEQQDMVPDRGPAPEGPATTLQPGGLRARRARLQHCPALSASTEEESPPGDNHPSRLATPEVTEPMFVPAPCPEAPSLPEDSPHPNPDSENQSEDLPLASTCPPVEDTAEEVFCASGDVERGLSPHVPEVDTTSPETSTATTLEAPSGLDPPQQSVQEEGEPTLEAPRPEGAGTEPSEAPAASPPVPKSCLKSKAPVAGARLPAPPTPPPEEPAPCVLDEGAAPQHVGPASGAVGEAAASGGARGSPCRRAAPPPPHAAAAREERPGLARAALDDLQAPAEPGDGAPGPQRPPSPSERGPQDSGPGAAAPARSPRAAAAGEDRSPFPVKLRATSLSFKHRDAPSAEVRGVKRYSAEVRLEKGGLTLLPRDDKCPAGKAPAPRGARAPSDHGKAKARPSEQPGAKPPLPRKPLLQPVTLPPAPAAPEAGPREPGKASRTAERRSPHRGAEKGLPPAATGLGAEGQPEPPWITITRQKRRGVPDQPPNQEDNPGAQTLKSEAGKQVKAPERVQEAVKQADFVRSKSFLIAPAKPSVDRRQGTELCLQEGLQRGISLSHQNLAAQSAAMMEKELHQLKRASYASADQPSWMELARKKSQAWSDMPQIIK